MPPESWVEVPLTQNPLQQSNILNSVILIILLRCSVTVMVWIYTVLSESMYVVFFQSRKFMLCVC